MLSVGGQSQKFLYVVVTVQHVSITTKAEEVIPLITVNHHLLCSWESLIDLRIWIW